MTDLISMSSDIIKEMNLIWLDVECENSDPLSATMLAEQVAFNLGHDEWLDDETHDVWYLAMDFVELKGAD